LINKSEFSWKTQNCLDDPKLLNGSVHQFNSKLNVNIIVLCTRAGGTIIDSLPF